ncbi:putative DNA helicase INO80 [Cocos nucifera]|uniref:Putative DNA helicase INO80 n=1 Tax=Cocos nucifera TaxID=13894 RepID=A0A8K0ICG4_COCNU|nr:putative DNA helicase INO80 [Cocos nucifera]
MTLKDFHGGSIPSELPLPSAPGVSVRPPERPGPWGPAAINAAARADHHRPRPGSAGGATGGSSRAFDERPPAFLSHPVHIGRHFDEDERKPFDASSTPRRFTTAEPVRPVPPAAARSDQKRPISSPVTHPSPVSGFPPSSGNTVAPAPNAWAARKEPGSDPLPAHSTTTMWSASRLAQASAVEKVSSGRWQSKPPEVEVIRFQETEVLDRRFGDSVRVVDDGDRDYERERIRSVAYPEAKERTLPGFYTDGARDRERVRSPVYPEVKERNAANLCNEGARPVSNEGRFGGSQLHQQGPAELLERPKLKLLPRTKPLEPSSETQGIDDKQGYQPPVSSVQVESALEMHVTTNPLKPGSAGADAGSQAAERPRLNLRPRSLPAEQSDKTAERASHGWCLLRLLRVPVISMHNGLNIAKIMVTDIKYKITKGKWLVISQNYKINDLWKGKKHNGVKNGQTVFGGARPREVVLKERGIDVVASNDPDMTVPANRVKNDLPKTDLKLEPAPTTRPGERAETFTLGQKAGRDFERKDHRPNVERMDVQRSSWRNENRRATREIEKPMEPPRPEPDTWRKPVEQPKPDVPGPRLGKAVSALELAQAFSKSVSDGRSQNRFTTQRSLSGRTQVPFSRLTDSKVFYSRSPQRQINGY